MAKDRYNNGEPLIISDGDFKPDKDWILNTTCIFHMCPNRDLFLTYETIFKCVVVMENNSPCRIVGIGRVKIKIFDGIIRRFGAIRHVLNLNRNLISLNTFDSKGYIYTYAGGVLRISKGTRFVLNRSNYMFSLIPRNLLILFSRS